MEKVLEIITPPECKTEAEKIAYAFGWFRALEHARNIAQSSQPADHRLADLHLYEEVAEHYAKCNISPEALRDWIIAHDIAQPAAMTAPQRSDAHSQRKPNAR